MKVSEIKEVLNDIRAYCSTSANLYDDELNEENKKYKEKMIKVATACSEAMDILVEYSKENLKNWKDK